MLLADTEVRELTERAVPALRVAVSLIAGIVVALAMIFAWALHLGKQAGPPPEMQKDPGAVDG